MSVQMFQLLIKIYRKGNMCIVYYHWWWCTSIYRPMSYHFRSLCSCPQKIKQPYNVINNTWTMSVLFTRFHVIVSDDNHILLRWHGETLSIRYANGLLSFKKKVGGKSFFWLIWFRTLKRKKPVWYHVILRWTVLIKLNDFRNRDY